jgi:predicted small secreted protein
MKVFGTLIGVILVAAFVVPTIFTIYLLMLSKDLTGCNTYASIAQYTWGYAGSVVTKLAIIFNGYGL